MTFGTDAVVHVLLVAFSAVVLLISLLAYASRRDTRYMFLSLAFTFLALSQVVELMETLFLSNQLVYIPLTGIHLSHFLDFLMLTSFSLALLVRGGKTLGNTSEQ
ncbi:MAG TPA: hypothetical protein VGS11_00310 [Candidatus Bathyarchaeia archaeon]|nr:hypothetical protein [Candidatus Bathyarchaeia archaeon]